MRIAFGRSIKIADAFEMLGMRAPLSKNAALPLAGICTDSREADAHTAFVALVGERVDGHDFIPAALERGCPLVISQRAELSLGNSDACILCVPDTEAALARLGRAYLAPMSHRTVAVTGSVGKTTTKDMIHAVLSQKMNTYCSSGNHNSVIGMPLSAMEVKEEHACAVFEMGMSGRGEIERMSLCAMPDIAVITNVGTSHMEMLGSRENIRDAKMEIAKGLRTGGVLLLNGDEPLLQGVASNEFCVRYVSLSDESADFFARNIVIEKGKTYFDACWKDGGFKRLSVSVAGRHNVYAGLYALAVGVLSGESEEEIRRGLSSYTAKGLRQNVCQYKELTLLEDCYNASPESMKASLDVLAEIAKTRRIACLGEMLELGDASDDLHREVGAYAAARGVDLLFCVGQGGEEIARGACDAGMNAQSVIVCRDRENIELLCNGVCQSLLPLDTVLIKGSRGVRMERVIEYIKNKY